VGGDAVGVDPVGDEVLDERWERRVVEPPQALVGEVTDPGAEPEPDHVVRAKEQVGEPGRIGRMLGDAKLAVAVAQGEDLVEGEQTSRTRVGMTLVP
jgi:hypothetical protein